MKLSSKIEDLKIISEAYDLKLSNYKEYKQCLLISTLIDGKVNGMLYLLGISTL